MLHTPAQLGAVNLHAVPDLFVQVEDLAVGTIADGVGVDLVAVLHGELRGAFDVLKGFKDQTVGFRQVGVGLQQPGTVGAQRSVHLALDGAHRQEVIAFRDHLVLRQGRFHDLVRHATHHDVETNVEFAFLFELLEEIDRFER